MPFIKFTSIAKPLQELAAFYPGPFLLALSGGPDSMALFHLLLALKIPFGVAHVDHNWRKESSEEAEQLRLMSEKADIPFYLKVLDPEKLRGNLEQACRLERLNFFSTVCKEFLFHAVILGHHQDDLAETVLKRILEGACMSQWVCMEKISKRDELILCRPWLDIPKSDILNFLEKHSIPYFTDRTNSDLRFLRAKMRSKMIPEIEQHLGKSIRAPLARLSKESAELHDFMRNRWASKLKSGYFLNGETVKTSFEMRFIVKHWLKNHLLDASYDVLEDLVGFVLSGKSDRCFIVKDYVIEVDRKKLFLRPALKEENVAPLVLMEGRYQWGLWDVEVASVARKGKEKIGWKNAFKGDLKVFLPKGIHILGTLEQIASKEEKLKIQEKWSEEKIPSFLRRMTPVIGKEGGGVAREFFLQPISQQNVQLFSISIKKK